MDVHNFRLKSWHFYKHRFSETSSDLATLPKVKADIPSALFSSPVSRLITTEQIPVEFSVSCADQSFGEASV